MLSMAAGARAQAERETRGWTQEHVAERVTKLGRPIHQTTIDKIEKRDSPRPQCAPELAAAFGVSLNWLLTGKGPKTDDHQEVVEGMPVLGEVRAGSWLEIDGEPDKFDPIPAAPDTRYRGARQYALKVVGTSMNRVALPGTYVVVADWADNGGELRDGELVVVRRERAHTYEVTLKRAKKGKDAWELWPESDDPRHQEPIVMSDGDRDVEVIIVGKVIGKYEPL